MNGFKRICAVIIGMVLLVAGILKMMDPVGSGLVMDEYLNFFHLGFLKGASRFIACALALIESLLGAALIAGVWRKVIALASGGILALFTILTIILYLVKPNMDCGCFGEIIHLNHAQTLLKNLILDALWCLAFIPMGKLGQPQRIKYVSFSLAAVSLVLFLLFSSLSIPLRDYTDFKPGVELDEHPLFFYDANYVYADSLASEGNVMVVSAYDWMKKEDTDKVADFARLATDHGYNVLLVVASTPDEIVEQGMNPALLPSTFFADRKELLTLNRSNGGATYIAEGQIICKRATSALPDSERLSSFRRADPTGLMIEESSRGRVRLQAFLLYAFAVMLLI